MKISIDWIYKLRALWNMHPTHWHRWFAWHPVDQADGLAENEFVWLETIERKFVKVELCGYYAEYRLIKKSRRLKGQNRQQC